MPPVPVGSGSTAGNTVRQRGSVSININY
jgi:hypothetical protein